MKMCSLGSIDPLNREALGLGVGHSRHLLPTPVTGTSAAVEKQTQDQVKSSRVKFLIFLCILYKKELFFIVLGGTYIQTYSSTNEHFKYDYPHSNAIMLALI